jgi:hypothetical protein
MLSVDTHCEMLTEHIRDRNDGIMNAFKLFVQMYSLVVGGTMLLRLEYGAQILPSFVWISDALAALIFLMSSVMILENVRSWYEYRTVLSNVAGRNRKGERIIPLPRMAKATKAEFIMLCVMALALALFFIFNPLRT